MFGRAVLAGVLAAAAASPALAQSWGFGGGIGRGPPPVYYYDEAPYYDEDGYDEDGPVAVAPRPRYFASPDSVFDMLEDEGFRELSPMAERGPFYRLNAVSPEGDLVALEISVRSGEIEREVILQPRRRIVRVPAPERVIAPPPPPAASVAPQAAPAPMRERLRPSPEEQSQDDRDPLVVY